MVRGYLELLDLFWLGDLALGVAGLEEGWGDRDAESLCGHSSLGALRVPVNDPESPEEQHQEVLGVYWQ